MPSQQVTEKLELLQLELETVSSAVKHIDKASKVAEAGAEILKNLNGLLNELKALEERHRKEILKEHKTQIDALEKQFNIITSELNKKAQKFNELIEDTRNLNGTIKYHFDEIKKINFPERLGKIDNQISAINIGIGNLQTTIQRSQDKTEKGFDGINDSIKHLIDENQFLKKEIKTNRTIQIVGLTVILMVLIYYAVKHW